MPEVTTAQRRARLGIRHNLAAPASDVVQVATDMVGLHSSDPVTVYLSARARLADFEIADLEQALYEERSLARVLGMRRTLWVVPTPQVPVIHNSSTVRLIEPELKRTAKMIEDAGIAKNGKAWHARIARKTLVAIEERGEPVAAMELREDVPELKKQFVNHRSDGSILGYTGVSTRVLFVLANQGLVIRARPRGTWISGQYRWSTMAAWLGDAIPAMPKREANAVVLGLWLRAFGPGTEIDLAWWTGWDRKSVRDALADLSAVEVSVDDKSGYLLPDDMEPVDTPPPWAALLPSLDPTTMGWKERAWYLGDHGPRLFDRNGNAGPTVWWEGRVVGGWSQRRDGTVAHALLEDVGSEAASIIEDKAGELEKWLDGVVVTARFRSPMDRDLSSQAPG